MSEPIMLEVREARGPFGKFCKAFFWGLQVVLVLGMLGTCAFVGPALKADDPEVSFGAGMFGAITLGSLWLLWMFGTVVFGALVLFTRGRKRLIPAPPGAS